MKKFDFFGEDFVFKSIEVYLYAHEGVSFFFLFWRENPSM